jgi:hypothetical protein
VEEEDDERTRKLTKSNSWRGRMMMKGLEG